VNQKSHIHTLTGHCPVFILCTRFDFDLHPREERFLEILDSTRVLSKYHSILVIYLLLNVKQEYKPGKHPEILSILINHALVEEQFSPLNHLNEISFYKYTYVVHVHTCRHRRNLQKK